METSAYQLKDNLIGENHSEIIGRVNRFCEKYIRPNIVLWDRDQLFPREVFAKMGEMGFLSVLVPPEDGGSGSELWGLCEGTVWAADLQFSGNDLNSATRHQQRTIKQ